MANLIYSNARAKYQENFLMDKERLLRLADCESYAEAIKVLSEVNFGGGVYDAEACDYEAVIRADEEKFYSFLREACPSEQVKEYILSPLDFHNAEALLKAKHLKISEDKMLSLSGTVEVQKLKEKIFSDGVKGLYKELFEAITLAEERLSAGSRSGAEISSIFKTCLYKKLVELSKNNDILKEVHSVRADATNVSIALRLRNFKLAKELFVDGGSITEDELKVLSEESLETLKERAKHIKSKIDVSLAIDAIISNKPLSEFERLSDGYALKLLKTKKYEQSGIIPFLYYCFSKMAEYKNVRIVLLGILNGHDRTLIKRRLRECYER